ncbi:MAG: hypothetical protein ABUS79_13055 [Pseudomonadota bacterium]
MNSDHRFRRKLWLLPLLPLVAATHACADFARGGPAPDASEPTDAGAPADAGVVSFATDVYPLLKICMNCHVPGGAASSTSLIFAGHAGADYDVVLKFVQTTAPASSRLLSKMSGSGHGGGTIYAPGTTQYVTTLAWIQQGAPP